MVAGKELLESSPSKAVRTYRITTDKEVIPTPVDYRLLFGHWPREKILASMEQQVRRDIPLQASIAHATCLASQPSPDQSTKPRFAAVSAALAFAVGAGITLLISGIPHGIPVLGIITYALAKASSGVTIGYHQRTESSILRLMSYAMLAAAGSGIIANVVGLANRLAADSILNSITITLVAGFAYTLTYDALQHFHTALLPDMRTWLKVKKGAIATLEADIAAFRNALPLLDELKGKTERYDAVLRQTYDRYMDLVNQATTLCLEAKTIPLEYQRALAKKAREERFDALKDRISALVPSEGMDRLTQDVTPYLAVLEVNERIREDTPQRATSIRFPKELDDEVTDFLIRRGTTLDQLDLAGEKDLFDYLLQRGLAREVVETASSNEPDVAPASTPDSVPDATTSEDIAFLIDRDRE